MHLQWYARLSLWGWEFEQIYKAHPPSSVLHELFKPFRRLFLTSSVSCRMSKVCIHTFVQWNAFTFFYVKNKGKNSEKLASVKEESCLFIYLFL